MTQNLKFQVRDTKQGLDKLDEALKILGYNNRADWYREKKREVIKEAWEWEHKLKDN